MTNQEWMDLFRGVPETEWNKTVIVLSNNSEISVDALVRLDANFLVMRGRVGGTIEESRGFVVPYHQMVYVRIERSIKIEELTQMFGESNIGSGLALDKGSKPPSAPAVVLPADPATASRLLLEKLRASRANAPGKPALSQAN